MIFAAVTGPMPGSVSSCSAVARLRSIGPPAPAGGPGSAAAAIAARRRLAPDRDVDLVAVVERRGEVELPIGLRDVDPRPEPACRAHRVADPRPRGQAEHARVGDRAADLDDHRRAGPSGTPGTSPPPDASAIPAAPSTSIPGSPRLASIKATAHTAIATATAPIDSHGNPRAAGSDAGAPASGDSSARHGAPDGSTGETTPRRAAGGRLGAVGP